MKESIFNKDGTPLVVLPELAPVPEFATAAEAVVWMKKFADENPEFAEAVATLNVLVGFDKQSAYEQLPGVIYMPLTLLNPWLNLEVISIFDNLKLGSKVSDVFEILKERFTPEMGMVIANEDVLLVCTYLSLYPTTKVWNDFLKGEAQTE